ncbi:MAG: carbohydrate ABC transporter permease [Limnochordaceae bacterium]|uniref:Carbohydrate ABC transporter permease n=1 Tax=Carboxydichorda subterranea TaxID=3109565 RepID=A0ABZ1BZQ8_9FIRM|nr:carbohydrate ABC transporter permease [Limnochorda sp. L945t]MBE3598748.1 carbohydrate ABC transporter permease [Limnochordaceae bacterium]WRP17986.1 carbohydrate ABC transporter permease [Limnochorda sp. L945t]
MGVRRARALRAVGKAILLIVGLAVSIFPYAYMVLQSLAPWSEVNRSIVPTQLTVRSYDWLLHGSAIALARPWLRAFGNSALVTSASTLLMLASALVVGYALSRLRWRGRDVVNQVILFQMFYPAIILLVPTFLVVRQLGMYDTYWGMIVPKAVNLWAIFMYVSFFKSIPQEVLEAARIDGAGELRIISRIVLPMSIPITAVVGLFLFMERWSELLWDLIVVKEYRMMTLNVLIATMSGPYATYPGPLYAASTLLTLPIVLVFVAASRYFTRGIQLVFK